MEGGRQNLVLELIEAGVMAGGYWRAIREDRRLEAGFTRLAEKHRAVGAVLMDEMLAGAAVRAAPHQW